VPRDGAVADLQFIIERLWICGSGAEGEGEMTARWLYSPMGDALHYQDGDFIYTKDGRIVFSVSDGWWFSIRSGQAEFFVQDNWVYTRVEGTAAYYFAP
jgi:hypothetical protein